MNEKYIYWFYGDLVSYKVHYKEGFFDYKVSKLDNIKEQRNFFRNIDDYIRNFKDNIIKNLKNLKNLNSLRIYLAIFDENNVLYRFIIKIFKKITNTFVNIIIFYRN